jgi:hypothetical protein
MIKLPLNEKWTQPNDSSKFGSILYSKNINLDENGFLKLSPRSVNIFDSSGSVSNVSSTNFNIPVAFGRYSNGSYRLATIDEPFNIDISIISKTIAEDSSSSNPNLTTNSHGCWWQNRFYESTSTTVSYNSVGTWTADVITGLSSSYRHCLCVFKNRNSITVSNGNVLKQYNTSHASTTDLTIPSDFEIIGTAYNNNRMAIITRLGSDSSGQNSDSYFFIWDGSTSEADTGVSIGAYSAVCVFPYKSSFVVINSLGQLLYWNGGGFDELAHFPFYLQDSRNGDLLNYLSYGDNIIVDGDLILINISFDLSTIGKKLQEDYMHNPSGIWCYDPEIDSLYHRSSPSLSKTYFHNITSANVNLTTNVFTTTGTIPTTGNPMLFTYSTVGGLSQGVVYYVIKLSSTTFSIATTKANAEAGTAIDITSVSANNYFFMFDIIDYGATRTDKTGAITLFDTTNSIVKDYMFGTRMYDSSGSTTKVLSVNIPFLKNIGYFVTPKFYLNSLKEKISKINIKHRLLNADDKIILKMKTKELVGIPTMTPAWDTSLCYWNNYIQCYTTRDLSEAYTAFNNGEELEFESISGIGAGQIFKIQNISYSSGTYTLTFTESVIGDFTVGTTSSFIVNNWKKCGELNYNNQNNDGIFSFPVGESSKAYQFKVILEGYETCIEEINFINSEFQLNN